MRSPILCKGPIHYTAGRIIGLSQPSSDDFFSTTRSVGSTSRQVGDSRLQLSAAEISRDQIVRVGSTSRQALPHIRKTSSPDVATALANIDLLSFASINNSKSIIQRFNQSINKTLGILIRSRGRLRSCFGRIVIFRSNFWTFCLVFYYFYMIAAHVGQILSYLSPLHHVEV